MIKAKPFATGQAQPTQSPYAGSTPYQKNPAGDFAAYAPQQNTQKFGNTTLNQSYSPGSSPYGQAPQKPTSPTDGNWANYQSQDRPAPFTARYGQPDGSYSSTPNYNQRDAFIQALNNQQTPYMTGQARGMPQYDIGSAWNQAGQMVQQGWQNPFTPNLAAQPQQSPLPNLAAQAFPSQYQPSNLSMAPPGPPPPPPPAPPPPAPSTGVRMAPGSGPSWTPVPGYGFDRQGNQVPVGKGGIFPSPPPPQQSGGRFNPNASQMVAGRGRPDVAKPDRPAVAAGAIVFTDRPATPMRGGVKRVLPSLADRPSKPADSKSWDAIYAARNKTQNNPDGTPKSHYELNKDGAYKGMTEAEAMRQLFATNSRASAYNNDPVYRALEDEKRRERMSPTMWAELQDEIVENGVRRRGSNSRKQSDVDAQAQWLQSRGLTGVPDGSRLDAAKLYEDYLSSQGKSIDSLMEERDQKAAAERAEREARKAEGPSYSEQLDTERRRRAQAREDVIRQFQQARGSSPLAMIRPRPGGRFSHLPAFYI